MSEKREPDRAETVHSEGRQRAKPRTVPVRKECGQDNDASDKGAVIEVKDTRSPRLKSGTRRRKPASHVSVAQEHHGKQQNLFSPEG